jgi:hypothetical protein
MTGTNCDFLTHKQSRSYLNHLVPCSSNFRRVRKIAKNNSEVRRVCLSVRPHGTILTGRILMEFDIC